MMCLHKSIHRTVFIAALGLVPLILMVSCSVGNITQDAGLDGMSSDGADTADDNKATWHKPAGYASVTFFVDDTANRTYTASELVWMGSFIYDPETNIATFDPNWAPEVASYPVLYDDGPISGGGHEMPGATASDHIFSTEIYLLADDKRDMVYQYGLVNSEGRWIWSGQVGSFVVPAGSTERIDADGFFIPAFGSYDLMLTLDTSQLNPTAWPFDPFTGRIEVGGSMISWALKQVFDDGNMEIHGDQVADDGVYTFIQSLNLGPHDGLLSAGQRVNFNFYIDSVPYVTGQLPPPGVKAWVNCDGSFEESAIFVKPDARTGQFQSFIAVCDDQGGIPVTSVVPSMGPASGGIKVSIYGEGFSPDTQVMFGSKPAKDVSVVDSRLINCVVPPFSTGSSSAGQVDVKVVDSDGEFGLLLDGFTYYDRLDPEVRLVSKQQGKTSGGEEIVIYGVRFSDGASVTIGGMDASSVHVLDPRRITCTSPAHPAGMVSVCVVNPDGTSDCLDNAFEYTDDPVDHGIMAYLEKPGWIVVRQDQEGVAPLLARVFIDGITQYPGCHQDVVAQLGWGPQGSDPIVDPNAWTWVDASCQGECDSCGPADEYRAWLPPVDPGVYAYAYRFRMQDSPWVYVDLWPGTLDGFQTDHTGYLQVVPSEQRLLLSRIEPAFSTIDGGQPVSLFGQGLSNQAELSLDAQSIESQFINDQEIRFTSPAHKPGLVPLTLVQDTPDLFQLTLPGAFAFVRRHTPLVDGTIGDDWPESYLMARSQNPGDWGPNQVSSMYASFDDNYLYLAARAWVDTDTSNALVIYLDMDYGNGSGVRNGDELTDDTGYEGVGGLDSAISSRFMVKNPGFGAEFALGTVGMAQVDESQDSPTVRNISGLRDISDRANFKWLPVTIKTWSGAPGEGMMEVAIPWESLLGARIPLAVMHLAFFARVVNSDGEYQCSCGLPEPESHDPLDVDRVFVLDIQ